MSPYFRLLSKVGNKLRPLKNLFLKESATIPLNSLDVTTLAFESNQNKGATELGVGSYFNLKKDHFAYFFNYIHMDKLGIVALFAENKANIMLLSTQSQLQPSYFQENLQKIRDELMEMFESENKSEIAELMKMDQFEFVLKNFHSLTQLYKHCNKLFVELFKNSQPQGSKEIKIHSLVQPLILLLQSNSSNQEFLQEEMAGLKNFTIIQFPKYSSDDMRTDFYSLDWQREVSKKMLQHLLLRYENLNVMKQTSYYLDIPIGNLHRGDYNLTALDLKYSRLLNEQQHISWHSNKIHPDFGNQLSLSSFSNEFIQNTIGNKHIVDKPNYYNCLTVELRLEGLAIASILQANTINETYNQSVSYDVLPTVFL